MYHLIVDTENYSGSFERELVAYATGCFGECGVGDCLAEESRDEMTHHAWWEKHMVMQEDDEYGADMMRPASIHPTPGWVNNGRGWCVPAHSPEAQDFERTYPAYLSVKMVVDELPPKDVWEEFQERVIEFCETYFLTHWSNSTKQPITLTGVRQESAPTPKRKNTI